MLLNLFLLPLISFIFLFFRPIQSPRYVKHLAFLLSLIPLLLMTYYNSHLIGMHVNYPWMPKLDIDFYLYMDNLSFLFSFLTVLIIPITILAMPSHNLKSPHLFFGLILFLEAVLIGIFTAHNLIFFLIFWETMLLPIFFIILSWGNTKRKKAAMKFLLYMMSGSVFLIISIFAVYFTTGTFSMYHDMSNMPYALFIFSFFCLAFAVKTPLFPFHAWLPEVYYEAPVSGTILLAGLLSKAGIYGFARIGVGMFPELIKQWGIYGVYFAIFGTLYAAFAAWRQTDFKRLIAYSSLSHVNFILAGLFLWSELGYAGAILQSINHGITITALFLLIYWLEVRLNTTTLGPNTGLCTFVPKLCWFTLFFVLSAVALPGTNNFIGEFLILFSLIQTNFYLTATLALVMIFSVCYMFGFMQTTFFETPYLARGGIISDIRTKEILILTPLIILTLIIGFYPSIILNFFPSVTL